MTSTELNSTDFLQIQQLHYAYGDRPALSDFSLNLKQGEIFGLLGPNGGGKSTLFKLLTTLRPLQQGEIKLQGLCYRCDRRIIRTLIGSVFQAPALDKKLSVYENLLSHGKLYALATPALKARIDTLATRFSLQDRLQEPAEKLSGGLQRRVELVKALLPSPKILIMDEPSTGLDPGIRLELWDLFHELSRQDGVTILLTTHLLEEAERCDRIALIHQGRKVVEGQPTQLCDSLGGQVLSLSTGQAPALAQRLQDHFQLSPKILGHEVRLRLPADVDRLKTSTLAAELAADPAVLSVTLSRPSLADLYLEKTGHSWSKN
ncbi:MAG: ABC transporter ATP-binding protein [Blastochloris sp.]|nr:ABC transporter ATP-binding protein [Blastochloris sp.]